MTRRDNAGKASLADLIPPQEHYYLLADGTRFARHGTTDANGLLVFASLERAEQFCMTFGRDLQFVPVKVSVWEFLEHAADIGAICVNEGLTVRVGTIASCEGRTRTEKKEK